jgi:drug/metabolite transporter (DMT)-like permease
METRRPDRITIMMFSLAVLFGGLNAIAVRYSNAELPPFFGATVRFGTAALIFFALALILRLPFPKGESFHGALIFGALTFGLGYSMLYWALLHIEAGLTMVILALTPLITFLLAVAHRQEDFRLEALIGALLAVLGIGFVFWDGISGSTPILPMLAVVGASIGFAEGTVILKSFPQAHPVTTNALSLFAGAWILAAISAIAGETPALPTLPATWTALFYLVVFGSVATFALVLVVIRRWTASASSYQFVLFPIVTILAGTWLANESVTLPLVIGGLFVLAGVYIGGIAKPAQLRRIYAVMVSRF